MKKALLCVSFGTSVPEDVISPEEKVFSCG